MESRSFLDITNLLENLLSPQTLLSLYTSIVTSILGLILNSALAEGPLYLYVLSVNKAKFCFQKTLYFTAIAQLQMYTLMENPALKEEVSFDRGRINRLAKPSSETHEKLSRRVSTEGRWLQGQPASLRRPCPQLCCSFN